MRKVPALVPLVLILAGALTSQANATAYFPLSVGRIWAFDDGNIDRISTVSRVPSTDAKMNTVLWVFESYNFAKRTFFREGNRIYEYRNDYRRLWYDFDATPGTRWDLKWELCAWARGLNSPPPREEMADINDGALMTVVAVDEKVSVPYNGEFDRVYHFKLERPGVKDAGYVEEWFAKDVGCIQRVWDTIAGPHMQKLAKVAAPGEPEKDPLVLNVNVDKEAYEYGEDIGITVTAVNNSDKAVTLDFNSSLQADYYLDNYQWSRDRAFTTATTSVTVPANGLYTWTFTHTAADYAVPAGKHFLTATVQSRQINLKAGCNFKVGPQFPSLPDGVALTIKTGKERYKQGEPVTFTLTATNRAKEAVTLGIREAMPLQFSMDTPPTESKIEPAAPTVEVTLKPGESKSYEGSYTADDGALEPGVHAVYARLYGYDNLAAIKFIVEMELTYGKVSGAVFSSGENNEKNLEPVAGADVLLSTFIPKNYDAVYSNMRSGDTIEFSAKTDEKGGFIFENVPVGVFYTLTVKKDGFYSYMETVRTLQDLTELRIYLKRVQTYSDDQLNVRRHLVAGLTLAMGTDQSAYKPDSNFKAVFRITNTLKDEVKFVFASSDFVDWYLETPDKTFVLEKDDALKTAADPEFTITLAPGESREFTRAATLKGRVPEHGGKYTVRAKLRFTSSSITTLSPGDINDYINILVVPSQSARLDAAGHNKEMVVDLKTSVNATINITTKRDNVSGQVAVTEITTNLHLARGNSRFIKMVEVDADSTIRADMDSALVRIYFDPATLGAGFDASKLVISHWDDKADNPKWEDLKTRVDTLNNFAEAYTTSFSSFGLFDSGSATGVNDDTPAAFRLDQNVPNPFNPATTIAFTLPSAGQVTLSVYNITGQEVMRLVDGALAAGTHSIMFNGSRFASGVYFYRITANGFTQAKKMLLVK